MARYRTPAGHHPACCPNGIAFGRGGAFGDDVFLSDPGFERPGVGIYRLTDLDDDGDFLDPGEADFAFPSIHTGVPPLTIIEGPGGAFGHDLYLADDRFNRVWKVVDAGGVLRLEPFVTFGLFTPSVVTFLPEGEGLLILDAWNFTDYGAGADARIFVVDADGEMRLWADSRAAPRGLWDINSAAAVSPDGRVVFGNHGIETAQGHETELLGARDDNGDGDALDPGEIRFLGTPDRSATWATGLAFLDDGTLLVGGARRILSLVDLDGDGDYWDFDAATWDPGERQEFLSGVRGRIYGLRLDDEGDLWMTHAADGEAVLTRLERTAR